MKVDLAPTKYIAARTRGTLAPTLIGTSPTRDAAFFVALTVVVTWFFWMPAAILDMTGMSGIAGLAFAAGSFAPLAVAWFLNAWAHRTTFEWVNWLKSLQLRGVLLAVLLPLLILGPVILLRIYWGTFDIGKALSDFRHAAPGFVGFAVLAFGEEVGWRGFLLGRLRSLNRAIVNLLIGVMWFAWQLPLIVAGSNDGLGGSLATRLAAFFVFSLLITPFFNRIARHSNMNVLLPTLLRASINTVFAVYMLQTPLDSLTRPYGLGPLAWLFVLNILLIEPLWLGKRAGGPETELELVMPLERATD